MITGDKVAVVAVYAVIGDAVVKGCRTIAGVVVDVALRGPVELLGAIETRNVTRAVQVVQFGGCEIDCLSVLLLYTANDDCFWNIGRRSVFTMLAQLSLIAGDGPSSEVTPPSGRGERKAGLLEGVLVGRTT